MFSCYKVGVDQSLLARAFAPEWKLVPNENVRTPDKWCKWSCPDKGADEAACADPSEERPASGGNGADEAGETAQQGGPANVARIGPAHSIVINVSVADK